MYDARHPAFPSTAAPPEDGPLLVPSAPPARLLSATGEVFAAGLSRLGIDQLDLSGASPGARAAIESVRARLERLEQIGILIQEVGHIAEGTSPLPRERIDLAAAARATVAEQSARPSNAGKRIVCTGRTLELEVNAAALSLLLDLGVTHAVSLGDQVTVGAGWSSGAVHPVLSIHVARRPRELQTLAGNEEPDQFSWLLFCHLAGAVGWAGHRREDGVHVTLTLAFPSELTQGTDADTGPGARTSSAAGRHALVVEPREVVRIAALRLLQQAGLDVHPAANVVQARAALATRLPDVLVVGIDPQDPGWRELIDEARASQPRLRVVQLVDDDDAFDFSAPGVDHPARVSRHALERTLLPAVAQELDAAWAP